MFSNHEIMSVLIELRERKDMLDFERKKQLISEAQRLAEVVNLARFEGVIPSDEVTVQLCEILDILANDIEENV